MELSTDQQQTNNPIIYPTNNPQKSFYSIEDCSQINIKRSNSLSMLVSEVLALKSTLDESDIPIKNRENN